MRATEFEFRNRFWIIGAIYFAGFSLFSFDLTVVTALRHFLSPVLGTSNTSSAGFVRALFGVGALLVLLSAMLRTWASAYLRTDVVHDTKQHSGALVADGPFRFTRNPLYLGNILMAAGIGVLGSRLGLLFLISANWFFVYRLIGREEAGLNQETGEAFRAYAQAVPRFWPAVTPRVAASTRRPQWPQAFAGESFVWLFAVAELVIAVTLNAVAGLIVFAAAFLAYGIAVPLLRKFVRKTET